MNFVFPQFLWALFVLAIPLLIHLFNFRRTTKVYFSNTSFLAQIKKKKGYKNKLKQYLVLLSRLLFLLFLVSTFAQPYLPSQEQAINTKRIVFYLDNSFSMSSQTASQERALDVGIGFIREMVESLPPSNRYKLLTNDFASFSNSFKTSDKILDLLTQIALSPISRTAQEVKKRIESDSTKVDLFWVSDFQKSTFGSTDFFVPGPTIHPIPIALAPYPNVYVDSVYLENPFSIGQEKNSIKVKIANTAEEETSIRVKLIINDTQYGIASIDIEPRSFAEVSFDLSNRMSGLNSAQINIDDTPVDFDNDFYFTLNFKKTIRVVEIKKDINNTYIKDVFGNSNIFSYTGFQANTINYNELDGAHLIILNGLPSIDPSLMSTLNSILHDNAKTLLFIPGENPNLETYQKFLKLSTLKKGVYNEMLSLEKPDFQNPFFSHVFEEQTAPLQMPHAVPYIRWGVDRSALLKFKNTLPFLSQRDHFFLMASPLKKRYTDFYDHALFVPVMYKIAASAQNEEQAIYRTLSDNLITVSIDNALSQEPLKLIGEQELVPNQHRVGKNAFLEIPRLAMTPGCYYIMHQQDTINLLAINLDKRESDLTPYDLKKITSLYGDTNQAMNFQALNKKNFAKEINERYLGTPLWKITLILALFFLLAEILLIRYLK